MRRHVPNRPDSWTMWTRSRLPATSIFCRALSGNEKLDYAGFSYGTYLGAHYAELFPSNTGRMVLDGAMDPQPHAL